MPETAGSGTSGSGVEAPGSVVCFDAAAAAMAIHQGGSVVLCGLDAEALAVTVVALRRHGRISVLIGDPSDDQVHAAALAMARELFKREPLVVPLPADQKADG